jgi:Protein of unknown function (DUF3604)
MRPGTRAALVALALACGEADRQPGPDVASFVSVEGLDLTEPDLASASEGELALVFLAFDGAQDRVMASLHRGDAWSEPIPVTPEPGAHLSPRVTADPLGGYFITWAAWDGSAAAVFAARLVDGRAQPAERISAGAGPALAPCAASGPDGSLWVAWQERRGGRFDVLARRRLATGFEPEIDVSNDPESDIQPALGIAADGATWIAWTSWRDGHYADGNYEIYARRLDRPSAPRRVSGFPRSDMLPAFARLPTGLALLWTQSTFPLTPPISDISAVAYDRWVGKRYLLVRIDGDRIGKPQVVLLEPDLAARSTPSVQAVPLRAASGDGVWLLYGKRVASKALAFDSRWQLNLGRTSPDSVSAPVDLSAGVSSVVARYAGAWSGTALWAVDEIERDLPAGMGSPRSVLRVRSLSPDQLPALVPAPPVPERPTRPISPNLALDRPPGERATVRHDGSSWHAFFGNLHLHSDLSGDLRGFEGRPEDNLQVLEDLPRLDFGALSDHAETLRPVDWWATRKLSELWNRPGAFVTLPGYEWTSLDYGHRVVLFPDEQVGDREALLAAAPGDPPTRLWSHLQGRAALTIPHHPSHALMRPVDWSFRDDRFQRLVEIFQARGSYEFDGAPLSEKLRSDFVPGHSVRDALAMGHRLGIIASPDHGGGLGLAGAWARELTREALFEALYARRTFGTTGAKLELFLTVAGAPQGSELRRSAGSVPIEATVRGTAPGLELTIVRDGVEVKRRSFPGAQARWSWLDDDPSPGARYYYLRARQSDGQLGWTSPVWLDP